MAVCSICGKKSGKGHKVSYSHKKTIRSFKPNLQKVKLPNTKKAVLICAKCLKKQRQNIFDK